MMNLSLFAPPLQFSHVVVSHSSVRHNGRVNQEEAKKRIVEIDAAMAGADFWADKDRAQAMIKERENLKGVAEGGGAHDRGDATISILAGAGGDDAEDFARMLFVMYQGYAGKKRWSVKFLDENQNDHGGFRNVTFEISGKNAYGRLKHEAGVHRLVRQSPFNASQKRQTSFVLVEVLPVIEEDEVSVRPEDLEIQFAKSGGAGGQNVNKRETAVRIVHAPTGLSVHVSSERSQQANREKALALIKSKVFAREEERRAAEQKGMTLAATTAIEWGNQIRSYVIHPYKMVKDHRTLHESHNPDAVLAGDLDDFIDAMEARQM